MKQTLKIIEAANRIGPMAVAFSGGSDSLALVDLIWRYTDHRPPLIYSNTGIDYPGTLKFIEEVAAGYGARLHIAEPKRVHTRQWEKIGYPMLGKLQAGKWTKAHPGVGFRLNCSDCCQNLKIKPGRRVAKTLGIAVTLTGLRGAGESKLREHRDRTDGALHYVKAAKTWQANPLTGWTHIMIRRYHRQFELPAHPARRRGAGTIGCAPCGGGSQFSDSIYRQLRQNEPELWRHWIVEERLGPVILAVAHAQPLAVVNDALDRLGGLEQVAAERPHVFDFTQNPPKAANPK